MTDPTVPPIAGSGPRSAVRAFVRALRGFLWWFNSILGGDDYRRYVLHLRRNHPDQEIPSESEYWRQRHDAADRNPGTRCC